MTSSTVTDLLRHALLTTFWLSLPLLVVGFAAGILISLLQIVTSIQDTAFGTVPRLAAFLAALLVLLPWMLMRLTAYTSLLFGDLARYAR
jgi:flagellar biosynthetic protein FliQ